MFLVVWQLVRQLVGSLSGYNNLVPFHLWEKLILVKRKKIYKHFVQDCGYKKKGKSLKYVYGVSFSN